MNGKATNIADRVERLAASMIQRFDVPNRWAMLVAWGVLGRLHTGCWKKQTDLLKDTEAELLAGWPGGPGTMGGVLVECGLCWRVGSDLVIPTAINEAPEYIKKRWQRNDPQGWKAAAARAKKSKAMVAGPKSGPKPAEPTPKAHAAEKVTRKKQPEPEPEHPSQQWLFGESPKAKTKPKAPGLQDMIDHWFAEYEKSYGARPPFQPVDAKHLKLALSALNGSVERGREAIDRYLRCDDSWYAGHPLHRFLRDINKWATGKPAKNNGTVAGDRRPLPRL